MVKPIIEEEASETLCVPVLQSEIGAKRTPSKQISWRTTSAASGRIRKDRKVAESNRKLTIISVNVRSADAWNPEAGSNPHLQC
jgi:hypothetical protein